MARMFGLRGLLVMSSVIVFAPHAMACPPGYIDVPDGLGTGRRACQLDVPSINPGREGEESAADRAADRAEAAEAAQVYQYNRKVDQYNRLAADARNAVKRGDRAEGIRLAREALAVLDDDKLPRWIARQETLLVADQGIAAVGRDDYKSALASFEAAMGHPEFLSDDFIAFVAWYRGVAAYRDGDDEKALAYFRKAMDFRWNNTAEKREAIADEESRIARDAEIKTSEIAKKEESERNRVEARRLDDEGVSLFARGKLADALMKLSQASKLNPNDGVIYAHWQEASAEEYVNRGDISAAVTSLRSALEYDVGNEVLKSRLQQLVAQQTQQSASVRQVANDTKQQLAAPIVGGGQHLFGTTSNPANPDLGAAMPAPNVKTRSAADQLASTANSSAAAAGADKIEGSKDAASCGLNTAACAPFDPIKIPRLGTSTASPTPALQKMLDSNPDYRTAAAAKAQADATLTTEQTKFDELSQRQAAATDQNERAKLQIAIADESTRLNAAKGAAEIADNNLVKVKRRVAGNAVDENGQPLSPTSRP